MLPGYPKQISFSPLLANISFYIQSPAGSSFSVVPKAAVVSIVQNSVASISSALNANVSGVQILYEDTTTATSPPVTTPVQGVPTEKENNSKLKYIIAGGVVGGVLLIIIILLIVVCWCKQKQR